MKRREIIAMQSGRETTDGAGVRLTRVISGAKPERFDPFLLLDEFGSDSPDDYIQGFPPHPHRGFETITYLLAGSMRHEDHMGHVGLLKSGGVQWMTAARGVIHSEMPQQEQGLLQGFQIWLNLPAKDKLSAASYRDYAPEEIPRLTTADGIERVVIAGQFDDGKETMRGCIQKPHTEPYLIDLKLPAHSQVAPRLPDGHRLLLYVFDGEVQINGQTVAAKQLVVLGLEGALTLSSQSGGRVLLLAARPLNEPIAQYGPFVMNSRAEIEQALQDYRAGRLAA